MLELARKVAYEQLSVVLPQRWKHVRAVGTKAEGVGPILLCDADSLVLAAAAWLHDIGYAPSVASTGFHALDGARWLRDRGFDARVTALVANHSCAHLEAIERGLAQDLATEFDREVSPVADALWYCDMTTGPDGQDFEVNLRLDEILVRYGPEHLVSRFIIRATPEIVGAVRRTEERLKAASHPM